MKKILILNIFFLFSVTCTFAKSIVINMDLVSAYFKTSLTSIGDETDLIENDDYYEYDKNSMINMWGFLFSS